MAQGTKVSKRKIIGYIVVAHRYGKDPLHFVGRYSCSESGEKALYNSIGGLLEGTLFPTRAAAKLAIASSKRVQERDNTYSQWNIDHWDIIALRYA